VTRSPNGQAVILRCNNCRTKGMAVLLDGHFRFSTLPTARPGSRKHAQCGGEIELYGLAESVPR
jgi:hypothetical protein